MTEGREIASYGGETRAVAPRAESAVSIPIADRMAMLREALTNPAVDTGKAREMFLLIKDMENDARRAEFNRSKIAAIRAMPAIFKRGHNTHLDARYAKFEDMHRAAMPVLDANALTLDFRISSEGRNVTVQPILRHDNGYIEEGGIMAAPPTQGKGINAVQEVAITASYLKRHSMKAMLNLIEDGEDTDGVMPREGDRLNDRQELLVADAQEAADAGDYAAWFGRLNARDKALLIGVGLHARLGGAPLLPGATDQTRRDPPAQRQQRDLSKHDITTPEGWTEQYEFDVAAARDREELARVQAKGKKAIDRLAADGKADLHKRTQDANAAAFKRLGGGE